jgi:hypothetical protein
MHAFATRRGWTVIDAVEDIASGAKDPRPKRQALLTAARQRKLDVILVWKLDRCGRSLVDLMTTLHERTVLGVGFVSLTEALDLTTPAGRACAGFRAVFAAFERDVIRARIKAGMTDTRTAARPMAAHGPQPMMRRRCGPWRSKASVKRRVHDTWVCGARRCDGCWHRRRGPDSRACCPTLHAWALRGSAAQATHEGRPLTRLRRPPCA